MANTGELARLREQIERLKVREDRCLRMAAAHREHWEELECELRKIETSTRKGRKQK